MANGNRRKEMLDTLDTITRRGESPTSNIINTKAQEVSGTTPRGRTTKRREVQDTDFRNIFKSDPGFFRQEDVTKPTSELFEDFQSQDTTGITRVQAPGVSPRGASRGVTKRTRTPLAAFDPSGQSDRERERLGALGKLKPGESIGDFTGGGSFSIAAQPIAQEGRLGPGGAVTGGVQRGRGKKPGIFTQRGIEDFFGGLGNLAATFASPEFQKQLATQRSAASTRKGRRADTEAKTKRLKTVGSLISDLSINDPDNPALPGLQRNLEDLSTSGSSDQRDVKLLTTLKEFLPDESIKTIFEQIRAGRQ